jgi:hypothetical protein
MCARVFGENSSPRLSAWIVAAMVAMIAVPAAITLHTVSSPGTLQESSSNPTPQGYSWSLLLFVVPTVVIAFWFLPGEGVEIPRRAFWRTIAVLVPLGFGLDFFFAHRFFVFPNQGATLGIRAPAMGAPVPVEEYIFYFTGFLAVLLLYVWLDEFWLAAYNVTDYAGESKKISRLFQFHPTSAIVGVILIVIAVIYKKMFSPYPDGFPGYFTALVAGAFVPAMSFFPTARPFINWRAFSLTLFFILLVSLLWEATLAVPYHWWGYQESQMMGLFIGAWTRLPIEAVCVWIAVTYGTVTVFEIFKLWQASDKAAKYAFLGTKEERINKN